MNAHKYEANCSEISSFWQEMEYRKRLKKLIERGLSVIEIEVLSQQIYEELSDERTTKRN